MNLKLAKGLSLIISNFMMTALVLLLIFALFSNSYWLHVSADMIGISCCVMGSFVALYEWYKGNQKGKYLAIFWAGPIIFTFILMLQLSGTLIYQTSMINIQQIGFAIEVILLSMALAHLIHHERALRAAAQEKVLQSAFLARQAKEKEAEATARQLYAEEQAKNELSKQVELKTKDLHIAMQQLATANSELKKLSEIDALTQLYNRRHFNIIYAEEFNRAQRTQSDLSVIMLDIDYFKQVNDRYGHQAGDSCLMQVAKLLRTQLERNYDYCARYGGEEFCVLLPQQNSELAGKVAEKIRQQAERLDIVLGEEVIHITISFGIASIKDDHGNAEMLLSQADSALYKAKELGRNRVCIYKKNTD